MIETKNFENVPFESLVGEHLLDAVDESTEQVKSWFGESMENVNCIRFRLDGVVYTAVEDPDDGYRSSMEKLFVSQDEMKNVFASVKVLARIDEKGEYGDRAEVLELLDLANGKVILRVGTENCDDYYPCFVASWKPENMAVNNGT